jgi:hypothetical protein
VLCTFCWGSLDEALEGLSLLGSGGRDCIPSKGLEVLTCNQTPPKTECRIPRLASVTWRWELYRPRRVMFRMDYGTVRTILRGAISSPAEVDPQILEEAIRWVEDKGTIRRLDRGADQNAYSSQFEAAAVEMRVLRRLFANGQLAGVKTSAQRVLTLLAT